MIHCYGMIIEDLEIKYQQWRKCLKPITTPIYFDKVKTAAAYFLHVPNLSLTF